VAVSGGPDSVALLCLLHELREALGVRLAVLHFNHQLRGAQSDGEETFVQTLAVNLTIPFFAGRDDVAAQARAHGWNLEDAARRLRYDFFSSLVHAGEVTHVAVAHTADDQAETVLARLVRGTGPGGLAAIYPVRGHIVRPLLAIRRLELRTYLEQRNQPWCEDPSNQDTTRLRARLRHDVLPMLEQAVQPAIVTQLGRLAQLAREDEIFWSAFVTERMEALVRSRPATAGTMGGATAGLAPLGIRCADLLAPVLSLSTRTGGNAAARAVTNRLVRRILESIRGDCRRITSQHVEQVVLLATARSSGRRIELPGVTVERTFDWLWFSSAPARGAANGQGAVPGDDAVADCVSAGARGFSQELRLGNSGEITLVSFSELNLRFRLKVIDWPAPERETNHDICALDKDLLRSPLVLRNWQPGDCMKPAGRRSAHKLRQFLRASRISVHDRAFWPVLTSENQVVWTRGLPVAAQFAPGASTRTGVVIAEEQIETGA
jgi:tRNA(Ile)-lysidine synthase